jgi:hypothetical protein
MDGECAGVELENDELAVTAHRLNRLPAKAPRELFKILPDNVLGEELSITNAPAGQTRGQRSYDGFNFR